MIAIVNVGPHDDPDPAGWRNYEVRINHEVIGINHEVIATFRHKREHGLARCLRMAAAAVDKEKRDELLRCWGGIA